MAEIQQTENCKKNMQGVRRSKKLSTKVDLTPMVDLGFLLITFFVFTASLSAPKTMKLVLPDDTDVSDSTKISESKTLNLILGGNDTLYYYNGSNSAGMQVSGYSPSGIRKIILDKKKAIKNIFGTDTGTVVVVKATQKANYKNIVDAIDEMSINSVKTYFLVDANEEENRIINSLK